jgi:hypothetical protein
MSIPVESTKFSQKRQFAPQLMPLAVKDEKITPEKSKYYKSGENFNTTRKVRMTRATEILRNNYN